MHVTRIATGEIEEGAPAVDGKDLRKRDWKVMGDYANGEIITFSKNARILTWNWWEIPAKIVRDHQLFHTERCNMSVDIAGNFFEYRNQYTQPHAKGTRLYVGITIGNEIKLQCKKLDVGTFEVTLEMRNRQAAIYNDVQFYIDDEIKRSHAIAVAQRMPRRRLITVAVYDRDPAIVAGALVRAGGVCEECKKMAPFRRHPDGSPYLEVHHKTPLSQGGEDALDNVLALCPNCHRAAHYAIKNPS